MAATKLPTSQISDVYSSSEVNTGKTWVDGRPIYRKVIRGTFTVAAGANLIAHGVSGFTNSMEIVYVGGGIKLGGGSVAVGQMQTFGYRETGGNWINHTATDATNITLNSSFAWGTSWITIVMEYAK